MKFVWSRQSKGDTGFFLLFPGCKRHGAFATAARCRCRIFSVVDSSFVHNGLANHTRMSNETNAYFGLQRVRESDLQDNMSILLHEQKTKPCLIPHRQKKCEFKRSRVLGKLAWYIFEIGRGPLLPSPIRFL